uniref:Aminotransferase class V domain-containing protein n=1 Tax=viral metagenome TaxID=1070528 RepID=A0A6C0IYL6_9ZZZZ
MTEIYLDSNATTFKPDVVTEAMIKWLKQGNPSGIYPLARRSNRAIKLFKQSIKKLFSVTKKHDYEIIITSGASESNCAIIKGIVDTNRGTDIDDLPHVVISMIEHQSTISCCTGLVTEKIANVSMVRPTKEGVIPPSSVIGAIRPKTVLVSIMLANNEIGSVNDIQAIASRCRRKNVLFHSDITQAFPKLTKPIDLSDGKIDALSLSFHKCHGPSGVGLLILRSAIKDQFLPLISGSQNDSLRGGTENMMLIAGASAGLSYTFAKRKIKNDRLREFRHQIIEKMKKIAPVIEWSDVLDRYPKKCFILITPMRRANLPNTLFFAIYNNEHPICSLKLQEEFLKHKVAIGVGSACKKGRQSHVLEAIGLPAEFRSGIVRISMPDNITQEQINKFCDIFRLVLASKFHL